MSHLQFVGVPDLLYEISLKSPHPDSKESNFGLKDHFLQLTESLNSAFVA